MTLPQNVVIIYKHHARARWEGLGVEYKEKADTSERSAYRLRKLSPFGAVNSYYDCA